MLVFSSIMTSAHETNSNSPFKNFIEERISCSKDGVFNDGVQFLKKTAKSSGFEIIYISAESKEGPLDEDYNGFLKRKTGSIKILNHKLLAVYFDPTDRNRFSVLLEATRNDILDIIKKNDSDVRQIGPTQFITSNTSKRGGYPPPWAIEIESCDETKNKNTIEICKQFNEKPLTWVGCAYEIDLIALYWMLEKMDSSRNPNQ